MNCINNLPDLEKITIILLIYGILYGVTILFDDRVKTKTRLSHAGLLEKYELKLNVGDALHAFLILMFRLLDILVTKIKNKI